jgi:hypothetical protein
MAAFASVAGYAEYLTECLIVFAVSACRGEVCGASRDGLSLSILCAPCLLSLPWFVCLM